MERLKLSFSVAGQGDISFCDSESHVRPGFSFAIWFDAGDCAVCYGLSDAGSKFSCEGVVRILRDEGHVVIMLKSKSEDEKCHGCGTGFDGCFCS